MYLGINIALENIFHEWLDSTSLKSFTLQWIFHRSKFNITYTKKKKKKTSAKTFENKSKIF